MHKPHHYAAYVAVLIVVMLIGLYAVAQFREKPEVVDIVNSASYACAKDMTMEAQFTAASVSLILSDGRNLTLPQVVSGSGIRYEQDGIAFIGKGNEAFLEENGAQTYANCIVNSSEEENEGGTKQFMDGAETFSFSYPSTLTVSGGDIGYTPSWMVGVTTPGLVLAKTELTRDFQPDTNFSGAVLTVGTSADPKAVSECLAGTDGTQVVINGTTYTKFISADAGAGNFYETTSYRTLKDEQCYALEYTIHSTNIGNYSSDQGITEFDTEAVTDVLEGIVQSFRFL